MPAPGYRLLYLRSVAVVAVSLTLLASALPLRAATAHPAGQPLPAQNLHPLKQLYLVPFSDLQEPGEISLSLQHGLYNTSMEETHPGPGPVENLLLDGELQHSELVAGAPVSPSWSISLRLPWIQHRAGNSDDLIETWHDWFGLPNGNRDRRPQDRIRYLYQYDQQTLIDQSSSGSALGDISLAVHYISPAPDNALGWQVDAGVTLPTGSEKHLSGSGATAGWLQLHLYRQHMVLRRPLGWFASGSLSVFENSGLLESLRRDRVWQARAGLDWQWFNFCAFKLQVDSHSAVFDSALESLGKRGTLLSTGIEVGTGSRSTLDIFITEDIDVNTAPDFGLGIRWQKHWRNTGN